MQGRIPRRTTVATGDLADPMAKYLLDLVDGVRDVAGIAEEAMVDVDRAQKVMDGLVASGHVVFGLAEPRPAEAPAAPKSTVSAADLAVMRLRVEMLVSELEEATHYEILGVAPNADKAAVKAAYFALSKEFHPDGQLGRRVGELRPRVEKVFRRLTEAYDALSKNKAREAYDAELVGKRRKPFEKVLHPESAREVNAPRAASSAEANRGGSSGASRHPMTTSAADSSASSRDSSQGRPRPPAAASTPSVPPPGPRPASVMAARPSIHGAPRPVQTSGIHVEAAPRKPSVAPPPMSASDSTVRVPHVTAPRVSADATVRAPSVMASRPAVHVAAQPISDAVTRPPADVKTPPSSGANVRPVTTPAEPVVRPHVTPQQEQRIARDLARAVGQPVQRTTSLVDEPRPVQPAAKTREDLARAIHASTSVTGGTHGPASKYERQAAKLEADGDLAGAAACMRLAVEAEPARTDLKARLESLEFRHAVSEVDTNRTLAKAAEKSKAYEVAAKAWQRVCHGAPTDLEARMGSARCVLAAGGDLRIARDHAQRAVDMHPSSVDARVLLAQVFSRAGMRLNALREAEAASKLDPANQLVKNLLRELK